MRSRDGGALRRYRATCYTNLSRLERREEGEWKGTGKRHTNTRHDRNGVRRSSGKRKAGWGHGTANLIPVFFYRIASMASGMAFFFLLFNKQGKRKRRGRMQADKKGMEKNGVWGGTKGGCTHAKPAIRIYILNPNIWTTCIPDAARCRCDAVYIYIHAERVCRQRRGGDPSSAGMIFARLRAWARGSVTKRNPDFRRTSLEGGRGDFITENTYFILGGRVLYDIDYQVCKCVTQF